MDAFFRVLLNMSYAGGLVTLAVLLLRLVLRKAPAWLVAGLWLVPLFRFLCPVSLESALALLPGTQPLPQDFLMARVPQVYTGIPTLNAAINPALAQSLTAEPWASANPAQIWLWLLGWAWLLGACGFLLYMLISALKLRRRLQFAVRVEHAPAVYESDQISTAFIWGVRKPVIYLPAGLSEQSRQHVLLHERTHIRRRDYLLQPLYFLALSAHWFNPLAWAAYLLYVRDVELACDESVMKDAGEDIRQAYSGTLLTLASQRGPFAALAFGQNGVKARIKSILGYKKPAFWAVAATVAVAGVLGGLLLLNPPAQRHIGVIGGADGPTSVYISRKDDAQTSAIPNVQGDMVVFYQDGEIARICAIETDEQRYFIDSVLFDHMIRSAAWPGVSMGDYPDRIDIFRPDSEASPGFTFDVFHVFVKDGKPCHQMGDGMYSMMSQELYEQLLLFGTPEFPDIAIPTPAPKSWEVADGVQTPTPTPKAKQ